MNNISRRDYFAAMSLRGMLSNNRWRFRDYEHLADLAVTLADTILKELDAQAPQDNETYHLRRDSDSERIAVQKIADAFELVATHPHVRTHTAAMAVRCALKDAATEMRKSINQKGTE